MNLIVALVVWAVVIGILCWIVSLVPLPPAGRFPIRNILYIAVALLALLFFLDIVGLVDLGWHPVRRL